MIFLDKFLQGLKPQFDDDVIDRLNYYYTPTIFIVLALTLSAKQYVGQPIQCWPPAQFTGAWVSEKIWLSNVCLSYSVQEQYSENFCFVQNTYFLPLTHYIPQDIEQREQREIGYYQWVPFVLGLQGILFFLPSLVWRIFNWQSGVAVKGIIQMCQDVGNMQIDKRKGSVEVVATHLQDSLRTQQNLSRRTALALLLKRGSYLNSLYIVVKFLYLIQVGCQFIILNNFLGTSYTFWGFEILRDLAYGREWEESGHFPRVTMCDFEIRVLGNVHRHTLQCVLMINMFNEKIYLFLWWWLLIVAFATLFNLVYWLLVSLSLQQQESFITLYLRVYHLLREYDDIHERNAVRKFVLHYLRNDGIFLLRLISANAGDLITTDIVYQLWRQFLKEESAEEHTLPLGGSPSVPKEGGGVGLEDVDFHRSASPNEEKKRLT